MDFFQGLANSASALGHKFSKGLDSAHSLGQKASKIWDGANAFGSKALKVASNVMDSVPGEAFNAALGGVPRDALLAGKALLGSSQLAQGVTSSALGAANESHRAIKKGVRGDTSLGEAGMQVGQQFKNTVKHMKGSWERRPQMQ
jgi:hypothetical protein